VNKRSLFASVLDVTGAAELVLALRRRLPPLWLPVLTFHRVTGGGQGYLFDDGVVDSTPEDFAHQMQLVADHFRPVSIEEVRRYVQGGALPNNPLLVTFDDGYRDNYEVALPILRRLGIPAVFFIATHYLEHRKVFWWDRISYLIKLAPVRRLELRYPSPIALELVSAEHRARATRTLLRLVKRGLGLDVERLLRELATAACVSWNDDLERRYADEMLMTWSDVRALRAAGMGVQSHTRTHRVLQTLSPDQVRDELAGSRTDLEAQLGERTFAISYPVGHSIEDRPDLQWALKAAGYEIGFTNATGAHQMWRTPHPYNIARMGLDAQTPASVFRVMLAAPNVF
jgi:peptidoglycan/xylan/chitin deacetylase (PgdA/CDA1 family)